jgi:hypothetical protein
MEAVRDSDALLVAFSSQMDKKPLPENIDRLIKGNQSKQERISILAMVATLAVVGVIGVYLAMRPGALDSALDQLASGERLEIDGSYLEVVASFRHNNETLCREFFTQHVHGVACRSDVTDRWQVELELPRIGSPAGTYQPAGTASLEQIDQFVRANMAGDVLSQAEEADLIARKWR